MTEDLGFRISIITAPRLTFSQACPALSSASSKAVAPRSLPTTAALAAGSLTTAVLPATVSRASWKESPVVLLAAAVLVVLVLVVLVVVVVAASVVEGTCTRGDKGSGWLQNHASVEQLLKCKC